MAIEKIETQNKYFYKLILSPKATKKFSYMGDPKSFFEWLTFKRGVCDLIECLEYKGLLYFVKQEVDGEEDKNYFNSSQEECDVFICFNIVTKNLHVASGI